MRNIAGYLAVSALVLFGCKSQQGKFAFLTPAAGDNVTLGQKLALRMQFPDTTIDSVVYSVDGQVIGRKQDTSSMVLDTEQIGLGARNLVAKVYKAGKEEVAYSNITIVPESAKQYAFEKVKEYPHDTKAFTQGLEFDGGFLYESTGAGDGLISSIRKVELETGKVIQKKEITGADSKGEPYFGEGMTIVGDRIIMLTWLNNIGYVFNKKTFDQVSTFTYENSKQGWGICYDGELLIKSDGSSKLYFLDPTTFKEVKTLSVYDSEGAVDSINELEYIDGKVYANVYGKDVVIIIDPKTGAVEGQINFVGLYTNPARKPNDQEMNGIAYDRVGKRLFVTGKQWDKLFEVKIAER
ncbi:glutaminyl-peptide cyclotransferase [Sphingobacterium psychroaquaticum]|nr:glutaminyl-peptide cyclotransferase [Sphingobacterium psychroaquaticum]